MTHVHKLKPISKEIDYKMLKFTENNIYIIPQIIGVSDLLSYEKKKLGSLHRLHFDMDNGWYPPQCPIDRRDQLRKQIYDELKVTAANINKMEK